MTIINPTSISGINSITSGTQNRIAFYDVNGGSNLSFLVGSASSTGTASQRLQVTGGAYVSGSLGVGTTSPVSALNVSVADGGNLTISNTNDGHTGALAFGDTSSNTSGRVSYDHFNNSMRFDTAGTERLRVRSDGSVCLGKGISLGDGDRDVTASIFIGGTVIASGAGNSTLKYSTSSGLVTYDTSSRLVKENIEDCPYGAAEIKLLKPRKYFRTDDQREEIGFVADELVTVLPEFVPIGPKSVITKNEEDTEDIPLGVNYEKLTAVLTKALQEAIGRIETLEAEVAALKGA
jgi:hypothetical protein